MASYTQTADQGSIKDSNPDQILNEWSNDSDNLYQADFFNNSIKIKLHAQTALCTESQVKSTLTADCFYTNATNKDSHSHSA